MNVVAGEGVPFQWDNVRGLFFWVNIAYSYALILFGSFLLLLDFKPVLDVSPENVSEWRARVLNGILRGIFIIWLFALAGGINNVIETYRLEAGLYEKTAILAGSTIAVYVTVTLILAFITFKRSLPYAMRAGLLLFIFYVLGAVGLLLSSLSGDGRVFLFALVVLAAILFDRRASLVVLGGSVLTMIGIGWLQVTGVIVVPPERQVNSIDAGAWVSGGIVFLTLSVAALISVTYLIDALGRSLDQSRQTLRREQRLSRNLRTISNINQLIVREGDQARLLRRACEILIEGRGFSLAWIGLLDEDDVTMRLAASAGAEIDADDFTLRLDDERHGPVCAAEALRRRIPFHAGGIQPDACPTCPLLPRYPKRVSVTLPLLRPDRMLGALTVAHAAPEGNFDAQEIELLTELADDLAYALEKIHLHDEIQAKALELERLYSSAQDMASSLLDPPALLKKLARHMTKALQVTSGNIMAFNLAGSTMQVVGEYWSSEAAPEEVHSDLGRVFENADYATIMPAMLAGEVLVLHSGDENMTDTERNQFAEYGIKSMMFVPILSHGQLFGDIEVWESRRRREFTQADARLAQAMAGHAASIIENSTLFALTRQRESELGALVTIARAVSSSLLVSDVLKQAASALARLLRVDYCSLSDYLPEQDKIVTAAIFSADEDVSGQGDLGYEFSLADYPATRKVLLSGQPLITRLDDPDADPAELRQLRRDGMFTSLLLPLRLRGMSLGLAELFSSDPQRIFQPEEVQFAGALAGQAAVAIENARLYERLERREAHFRALIENSAEGVAIIDAQGIILYLAPSEKRLTGYSVEEIVGASAFQYIHPDDLPGVVETFNENVATPGAVRTMQYRLRRKDGEWRTFEAVGQNMLDDPHIAGVVVNYRDITKRKQAEEAERRQNQYLTALQATTLGLIGNLNLMDLLENLVTRAAALVGTSHGAVLLLEPGAAELTLRVGIGIEKDYLGVRIRPGEGLSGTVWQTGQPLAVNDYHTWVGRKPDPSHDIFRASAAVPLTSREQVVGVLMLDYFEEGSAFGAGEMDILRQFAQLASVALENARLYAAAQAEVAERRQAELALRESQARLEGIINTALNAIITVNEEQRIVLFNPYAETIFACKSEFALGKPLDIFIPARYRDLHRDKVTQFGATNTSNRTLGQSENLYGLRADGEEFPLEAYVSQQVIGDKKFFTVILRDITERKRAEEDLRRRAHELEALATASAALRTAQNVTDMVPVLAKQALRAVGGNYSSIFLLDPASGDYVSHGWFSARGESINKLKDESILRHRPGEGITGHVAVTGEIYVTEDMQKDTFMLMLEGERKRLQNLHGGISLPLRAQEKIIGVLHIWMVEPHIFNETEIRILIALAEIASNAIHRAMLFEQTLQHADELAHAYDNTLAGWARALELRDEITEGHTRRVTELTLKLASAMGIPDHEMTDIQRGALLHDIGKMGIPDAILQKPGAFTVRERRIMQQHPQYARDMLAGIPFLQAALDIPYCHHEHWDGSGYPRGLKGMEIPLAARIFSIIDVWDALTSDRPYRSAWSEKKTLKYIRDGSGKQFDPRVVEAFLRLIEK